MEDIALVIKISEKTYAATCKGNMLPPDVKNVVEAIKKAHHYQTKEQGKMIKGTRDPYKVDQIDAILDSPDFYAYLSGDKKTSGAKTINLDGYALEVLKALYEGKTVTIN